MVNIFQDLKKLKRLIEFHLREIRLSPCKKQKLRNQLLLESIKQIRNLHPNKIWVLPNEVFIQKIITSTIKAKTNKITFLDNLDGLMVPDFSTYNKKSIFFSICRWNTSVFFVLLFILFASFFFLAAAFAIVLDIKRPELGDLSLCVHIYLYWILVYFLFFNMLFFFGLITWKTNVFYFKIIKPSRKMLLQGVYFLEVVLMFIFSVFLFSLASQLLPLEIPKKWEYCGAAIVVYLVFYCISLLYSGITKDLGSPKKWLFHESPKAMVLAIAVFLISLILDKSVQIGIRDSLVSLGFVVINLFPVGLLLSFPKNLRSFRKWMDWNQINTSDGGIDQ